jgi:hypothetical protein
LPTPLFKCEQAIRETFEDALLDRRDLLNTPIFRNTPTDFQQKKYFATAFDVAQKIRAKMTILDVNKLVVSVLPSAFAFVDCFARDGNGNFWLLFCTDDVQEKNLRTSIEMSIVSYIFNVGGYIPTNVSTRIGVWIISPNAPKFIEIPNDQIAARDFVIKKLQETPF